MRTNIKRLLLINSSIVTTIAAFTVSAPLSLAGTEEAELARIATYLKPISDQEWNEIAGPRVSDTYQVQRGDNLWNISKSLFGNPFYWAKVWTFNNAEIGNPHLIEPGQNLTFNPGRSGSIPMLSNKSGPSFNSDTTGEISTSTVDEAAQTAAKNLKEYEKISPEMWAVEDPPSPNSEFDEVGIDRDLKVDLATRFNFRVPSLVNESTLPHLGEIKASRRDGTNLSSGEVVFIQSTGKDLQVGTSYSILSEGTPINEKNSDRVGYAYRAIAEVRVIGVKDSLFVAEITNAWDVVKRNDRVYPLLPLISAIEPTPGRAPIESVAMLDPSGSVNNVSQHRFIFFDRGLEDGVEPGNVFRLYQYYDPVTQKKITESDFLISADAMVVHSTAQFSTALILNGIGTVSKGDFGILLTDIKDLQRDNRKGITKDIGSSQQAGDQELDELDELDKEVGEGLGRQEELEVKELDQWDRTKDIEPAVPSDADPNAGDDTLDSATAMPMDGNNTGGAGSDFSDPVPVDPDAGTQSPEPLEPLDGFDSSSESGNGDSSTESPETLPDEGPLETLE
jgi:hypothetical protein